MLFYTTLYSVYSFIQLNSALYKFIQLYTALYTGLPTKDETLEKTIQRLHGQVKRLYSRYKT